MSDHSNPLPYQLEVANSIKELEARKLEALAITNPKMFIKKKVNEFGPLWWSKWEEDIQSEEFAVRRNAQIEYNKLQCRVLPTELTSPEDGGVIVRLAQYQQAAENNNQIAEASSVIDTSYSPADDDSDQYDNELENVE